jgi:hypothetical protein
MGLTLCAYETTLHDAGWEAMPQGKRDRAPVPVPVLMHACQGAHLRAVPVGARAHA